MGRQIKLEELMRRGAAILADLAETGEPYVVKRAGTPVAALFTYEDFMLRRRGCAESPDKHFDRVVERLRRLNTGLSDEEVAREVAEAIAEVRAGSR